MHLPAEWDGGPHQPIAPGTTWTPEFTIKQQAATLWYHPHAMGLTGEQVYHGLAGLVYIEDEVSDQLDIPKTYGIDDIPLVIQDRRFFNDGRFAYVQNMHDVMNGVIGNYLLVNGAMQPSLKVPGRLVRLRLLNDSNSSIYRIGFGDHRIFHVIASGGGTSLMVEQMKGDSFTAMRIATDTGKTGPTQIPTHLRPLDRISESEAGEVREFIMETMAMGGGMMG